MEPTLVRIGVMDSRRPQEVVSLPVRHLRQLERVGRGLKRMLSITGIGLLVANVFLLVIPLPHIHLCLLPIALTAGPIIGVAAWRQRVLLAAGPIACPRCDAPVLLPAELPGWPARLNCESCAAMVELNPATPAR
ncbi:MAG: hypothetical protein AB1730_22300 [Myxococcota bacterium]